MESAMVIQDKIFLFASAFFRVDNTEWVNNHELIYEDNEDEIVNKFNIKLENGKVKVLQFLQIVFETIYQFYLKRFSRKQQDANLESVSRGPKSSLGRALALFDSSSNYQIKNYNGFYSGRTGKSGKKPSEEEDIWTRIKRFLTSFLSTKATDNQEEIYYPRRMYRGNSLD